MNTNHTQSYWHFTRAELTKQLVNAIKANVVQSFTLFAPRRIGKTEFLEYDLKPALEANNYKVIYFSFYSDASNLTLKFIDTLKQNVTYSVFNKLKIKEIDLPWCKISLNNSETTIDLLQILTLLAVQIQKEHKQQLILLLDEVQELQNNDHGKYLIAGLRTALDLNKEWISVIFTGSSQDGLRRMFNDKKAPFFHFGMNIQMKLFGREFTDFLADRFYQRLKVKLDKNQLYDIFLHLDQITEYIKHIVAKMVLEPTLTLEDAYTMYITELYDFQLLERTWQSLSIIEQAICLWLKAGNQALYTKQFKEFVVNRFSIPLNTVTQGKIQYALDKLLKMQNVVYDDAGTYIFHNQFLSKWIDDNELG